MAAQELPLMKTLAGVGGRRPSVIPPSMSFLASAARVSLTLPGSGRQEILSAFVRCVALA